MAQDTSEKRLDSDWKSLYKIGGLAALVAAVVFRRNLAAEIGLFTGGQAPATVGDWFAMLNSRPLLGLAYLNLFDVVNYVLVGLMFLALYVALRRTNRGYTTLATALGFLGIGVYLATNTALSMLSLSGQYAAATTETQRAALLGAGDALLALGRFTAPGSHPGSGGYVSLLLVALAGLIASAVMIRSERFNRVTAYVGILAGTLDLAYCVAFAFVPAIDRETLALLFIPAAGLLWVIWHILVGWRLCQLGRLAGETPPESA